MANQINKPINEAADQGVGLAFVAYPAALSRLPVPWLWSAAFFLMLILLGFGTQMTFIETIVVNCGEILPKKYAIRKQYMLAIVCVVMFAAGLPMCTQAGVYILQLMDSYSVPYAAFIIGFFEMIAISWVYGIDRYLVNLRTMLGFDVFHPLYWKIIFKYGAPSIIVVLLALVFRSLSPLKYNDYEYPGYANWIGWTLTVTSVALIPAFALYELSRVWRGKATYKEVLKPDVVFEHFSVQKTPKTKSGNFNGESVRFTAVPTDMYERDV